MFHSRRINKVEDFLVCYIRKRTTKIVLDYSLVDADYKNKSKNKMVFFVSFLRKNKQSLTELCGIVFCFPNIPCVLTRIISSSSGFAIRKTNYQNSHIYIPEFFRGEIQINACGVYVHEPQPDQGFA